jgi:hypothetical protein
MNQKKRSNLTEFIQQYHNVEQGIKTNNNSKLSDRLVEQSNTPDAVYRNIPIPTLKVNLPIEKSITGKNDQSSDDDFTN